jgi:hypothetical protein
MSDQFDVTEPLDENETALTGRINSDLPFEEALKVLLREPVIESAPEEP